MQSCGRWTAMAAWLALAGCAAGTEATNPDGTWVGTLVTSAGSCPDTQPSDLVVSDREVSFVPGDGVLALRGKRGADPDALHAQLLGTDMNHHPLPMVFDGRLDRGAVRGTYGTPACRAEIVMHRPEDTGLSRVLGN